MIRGVYAVRDALTGFLSPVFDESDAVAVRNFQNAVLSPQTVMFTHPQDYSIWRLAWFDTKNGSFLMSHPDDPGGTQCPAGPLSEAAAVIAADAIKRGATHYET